MYFSYGFLRNISIIPHVLAMKKPLAFLALVVFVFLLCSFLVKVGQAGRIGVGTYYTGGVPTDDFVQGYDVRIIADSSDIPITINVTDPDGVFVHTETHYGYVYDKILSNLTQKIGKYTVEVTSPWDEEQENYARTYYNVFSPIVGGKAVPINIPAKKPELQFPWIWLPTIILLSVTTVVYVKLKKKKH